MRSAAGTKGGVDGAGAAGTGDGVAGPGGAGAVAPRLRGVLHAGAFPAADTPNRAIQVTLYTAAASLAG